MTGPSSELIVCDGIDHLHCGRKAFFADLVAVVRRGVEEGTIKGWVRGWCSVHDAQAWDGRDLFCLLNPGDPEERSCQMERTLVIPFELDPIATSGQPPVSGGGGLR